MSSPHAILITKGETVKPNHAIYCAAAAAVAVAGVIHLMLGAGSLRFNGSGMAILFTAGGLLQIFWIIPMARRWGPAWYVIGIAGNISLFVIWLVTRYPGNPINGRGFGFPTGFNIQWIEEAAQLAYIGLTAAILALEAKNRKLVSQREKQPAKSRKRLAILVGIVAALIVFSLFVLPALMPRQGGGQRGPPPGGFPQGQGNQNPPSGFPPAQQVPPP